MIKLKEKKTSTKGVRKKIKIEKELK